MHVRAEIHRSHDDGFARRPWAVALLVTFIVCLILFAQGCGHDESDTTKQTEGSTNGLLPSVRPIVWSGAVLAPWVIVDPDSVLPPRDTVIDMGSLETVDFVSGDLRPLPVPATVTPYDFNALPDTTIDFTTIKETPLFYKTYVLGSPRKLGTGIPRMKDGATDAILHYRQEHNMMIGITAYISRQDREGRMWFGTNAGLIMYDGENSYLYTETEGLASRQCWSLGFDSAGNLWCGGLEGLDVIDLANGVIRHLSGPGLIDTEYILDLEFTRSGTIVLATVHNISLLDPKKQTIQCIDESNGLRATSARAVTEDRHGRIWCTNPNGIAILDRNRNRISYFERRKASKFAANYAVHEDASGRIWMSHFGDGLFVADEDRGTLTHLKAINGLKSDDIRSIVQAETGEIFIACGGSNGGLTIIDSSLTHIRSISSEQGVHASVLNDLFIDRERQLWMTSPAGGLAMMNRRFGTFHHISQARGLSGNMTCALLEDSRGSIWMGTENGIDIFEPSKGIARRITQKQLLGTGRIMGLMEDSKGMIWVCFHGGGFTRLDPRTGRIVWYGQQQGIRNYDTRKAIEDRQGNIWVCSIAGLNRIGKDHRYLDKQNGAFSYHSVVDILEAKDGRIWIGTGNGAYVYDPLSDTLRRLNLSQGTFIRGEEKDASVESLLQDKQGRIWIGSAEGLYVIDESKDQIRYITEAQGLTNNSVYSLVDGGDLVYAGTRMGLNAIRLIESDALDIASIGSPQGLAYLDFQYKAAIRTSGGDLWWGVGSGVTRLQPRLSDTIAHTMAISGIDVMGEPASFITNRWRRDHVRAEDTLWDCNHDTCRIVIGGKSDTILPIHKSIEWGAITAPYFTPASLTLPYDRNNVVFHFTANRTSDPSSKQYSYIVDGLEESWSALSDRASAEYRNLPPGDYTYRVRSLQSNRKWSNEAVVQFTVTPPWWLTNWAYVMYLMLLGGVVVGFVRFRHSKLVSRQRELEKTVAERTSNYLEQKLRAENSERIKEQFLANMSHEIRTPMNAVMGMTEILLRKHPTKEQRRYLDTIRKASDSLLAILNDILDLSKIEAGKITLEHVPFSMKELMTFVAETLEHKATEKGVLLSLSIDKQLPANLVGDPTRVQQIMINLVGNAIKFTEHGEVTISCRVLQTIEGLSTLRIEVRDTGIGMSEHELGRIFDSFEQASTDTTRKFGGTGLGLSISRHLVRLLGSEIEVQSTIGVGSTFGFTISLPTTDKQAASEQIQSTVNNALDKLTGVRILLAEDNELNRIVTRDTLALHIADVHLDEALNGAEAIELLRSYDYDLILMDVNMPVLDGYDATIRIRSEFEPPKSTIPIIALTAAVVKSEIERSLVSGMNRYVPKPFRSEELIGAIADVMGVANTYASGEEKGDASLGVVAGITDLSYLRQLTEGDETAVRRYVRLYLESGNVALEQILSGASLGDHSLIAKTLHQLRPHLGYMGMDRSAELAKRIEHLAMSGEHPSTIQALIDQLKDDCERSFNELSSYNTIV